MKICSKCNIQFDDGKKFCTKCGSQLISEQTIDDDSAVSKEQIDIQSTADDVKKEKKPSNSKMMVGIITTVMLIIAVATIILYKQINTKTDEITGMEFVFVKGGCYQMGNTFSDGDKDEKPVHNVCVSSFYIGKYEVTQGQWKKVMGSNPSGLSSCGNDCPVENVSWNDVQEFIGKLTRQSGKNYRLPTEAEWEYAARSGGKKEKYSGTDDSLDDYAWYSGNSGSKTHAVGQKKPNGLGIYDMTGNVWEWCSDWYGGKYYGESPRDNPGGPSSGFERVRRGGSWYYDAANARASLRCGNDPDYLDLSLGFRLIAVRGQ